MADRALSTTRRALLGAAASIPVLALAKPVRAEPVEAPPFSSDRALWNRRLARYGRLAAEAEEAATTGWFFAANARYDRALAEIETLRTRFFARPEEVSSEVEKRLEGLRRAAFERVAAAEETYWSRCTEPMQRAAVALALTPAPDLPALAAKIGVMRAHELHELASMTRDCFEVLEGDVGRLTREIACSTPGEFA